MDVQPDQWQQDILNGKGDKIICTGRQVGKTEICAEDAVRYALSNSKKTVLMIAPTERQARLLYEKTLRNLMENHLPKIVMGKDRPTKSRIKLRNKTEIYCLPTGMSGIGIRGLTVSRLYVDEAARIPEEVWAAVTPMLLTTGGDTIMISTPDGCQGEFYRCWINKDTAYDSFTRFSINSEEVIANRPICSTWSEKQREKGLQKIEQARARMSNLLFAQEYLGEFVDALFKYFTEIIIKNCCIAKRPESIDREHDHFLGCDIARMGEDEGTFEILKRTTDKVVQVESIITRKQLTTQTEQRIIELNRRYEFRKIAIDAGAGTLGVSIYDHLLQEDDIKRVLEAVNNASRVYDRDEKRKTNLLKLDLYDNLRGMMQRGDIELLDDPNVIESLLSIRYEYVTDKKGQSKMTIYGDYAHVVEGIIRAAWYAKGKPLNIFVQSIRV